jgi:fimbrial chaperone protein
MRIALLALAGAVFAGNAFAATTVTNSFQVKATVVPACVVSQATVMNFGNYDPLSATAATTTSTVGVRCTKGTNYSVALNEGVNFSAAGCDTPLRRMTDGTNFLTYAITSTSGGSAWGCNARLAVRRGRRVERRKDLHCLRLDPRRARTCRPAASSTPSPSASRSDPSRPAFGPGAFLHTLSGIPGMRSFRTRSAAAFVALGLLTLAGLAVGSPVRAGHDTHPSERGGMRSETMTVTNQEQTPLIFEVAVKRWRQDDKGDWQLVPEDGGLVVHPLILRIEPGKQGRLRIGSLSPTVSAEAAYRIELTEVPDRTQQKAGSVMMRSRVSVPVFVQPPNPKAAAGAFRRQASTHHSVHLRLRNTGTAYRAPGRCNDCAIRDSQPARSCTKRPGHPNYVLAGAQWPLEAKIPRRCLPRAPHRWNCNTQAPRRSSRRIAPGTRRCAP